MKFLIKFQNDAVIHLDDSTNYAYVTLWYTVEVPRHGVIPLLIVNLKRSREDSLKRYLDDINY